MNNTSKKNSVGIALLGPMKNENHDRDVIEAHIFSHYQTYAEPASREFKGFYALYDQYAPSYLVKEDDLDELLREIEVLKQRNEYNNSIILELEKLTSMIEKGKKIDGFIIMVTPYLGYSIKYTPIEDS